ncbi:LysR family transcriptional regulator [Paramylibacter ulvae]
MIRNLDMTALRSFVTVADVGGVTKAAAQLHLTQSAVSMQLKRLEESMGLQLLDRSARSIGLTAQGELLLSYGRRLLSLNDEAWNRLTADDFEGEVTIGVPHDIVYPHIPQVLRRFKQEFPRVKVNLLSSFTVELKRKLERGEVDLILGTEARCPDGATVITASSLTWFADKESRIWNQRPLPLAYEDHCLFRSFVIEALDQVGIPWEVVVETKHARTVEVSVSAGLALHACLKSTQQPDWCEVPAEAGLPALPEFLITMHKANSQDVLLDRVGELIIAEYKNGLYPRKKTPALVAV